MMDHQQQQSRYLYQDLLDRKLLQVQTHQHLIIKMLVQERQLQLTQLLWQMEQMVDWHQTIRSAQVRPQPQTLLLKL